jgi:hypothetical protein
MEEKVSEIHNLHLTLRNKEDRNGIEDSATMRPCCTRRRDSIHPPMDI